MIEVIKPKLITTEIAEAIAKLLPQLSPNAVIPDISFLQKIADSENSHLFLALDNNEVLGMLTLVVYDIPTGCKAWVEDVVVDQEARGKRIAKILIDEAINDASKLGITKINLTSGPSRTAAHALYLREGFIKRDTLVFRKTLKP